MNNGYTKLFSSIVTSSVWRESKDVKILWITMLAMSDQHGDVQASLPGIANLAGLTIPEAEEALAVLTAPDPYSRSKEFEGRRVAPIDGGWKILNRAKYREKLGHEDQREYWRQRKASERNRKRGVSDDAADCPSECPEMSGTVKDNEDSPYSTEYREHSAERNVSASMDLKGGAGGKLADPESEALGKFNGYQMAFTMAWGLYPAAKRTKKVSASVAWAQAVSIVAAERFGGAVARAEDWLVDRIRQFSKSALASSKYCPGLLSFLVDGRYDDDAEAWLADSDDQPVAARESIYAPMQPIPRE